VHKYEYTKLTHTDGVTVSVENYGSHGVTEINILNNEGEWLDMYQQTDPDLIIYSQTVNELEAAGLDAIETVTLLLED